MYNSFGKYKTTSRVQIFLGLCLACCFILLSGSYITKADSPAQQWGSFYSDKSPRRCTVPGDSQVLSLLDMIEMYYPTYDDSSFLSYNALLTRLNDNGLLTYFTNWDPYNPQFYVNIEVVSGWSSIQGTFGGTFLYFSKTNQDFSARSSSFGFNHTYEGQAYFEFLSSNEYTDFISFDFSMRDIIFMSPFVITYPTNNDNSSKYFNASIGNAIYPSDSNLKHIQYNANPNGYGNLININSIPSFNGFTAANVFFPTYLNSWLSDDDSYFLTIFINRSSSTSHSVVNDRGINWNNVQHYPLFSQFAIYNKNDFYSTQLTDYAYNDTDFPYSQRVITFSPTSNFNDDYYPWKTVNGEISYIAYPYRINLHGLPTPSPIPTWSWSTPTPFPTYIVNATLTPIAFINDPELPVGDSSTFFGNLAGFLNFFNSYFNENPFPKVFAYSADLIYSFSPIFKFFLLVPIIALIAMIIGRLRRK